MENGKAFGLRLNFEQGKIEVTEVKKGGPCDGKLEVGDLLKEVNGVSVEGRRVEEIVVIMQGEEGSSAVLSVLRGSETKKISVVRKSTGKMMQQKRVDLGFKKRNAEEIRKIFEKFAPDGHIPHEKLIDALKEFDAVPDLPEEALKDGKELFKTMDKNLDGKIDLKEFILAVQKPTHRIEWVRMLPLVELLEDAAPRRSGTKDPLSPSEMEEKDIENTAEAFAYGLKHLLFSLRGERNLRTPENPTAQRSDQQGWLKCGRIADFDEGPPPRIGHPRFNFEDAMCSEHCSGSCSNFEFQTTNTMIKTFPKQEWNIVVEGAACPPDHLIKKRRVPKIDNLMDLSEAKEAKLSRSEALSVVLYSGPMYYIYNSILRQYPADIFDFCKKARNLFTTTIHVLVSAVQKLCRVTKIEPGLTLYRGLGFSSELPNQFFDRDCNGCSGFTEWGFMSTTSRLDVAIEYSKVKEGNPSPKVLVMQAWTVDRGACIKNFSQYPAEVEYLFIPCSFVEKMGHRRYEKVEDKVVTMVPVRVNVNLKAKTIEQLQEEKKEFHILAFVHLVRDVEEDLHKLAKQRNAQKRLEDDKTSSSGHTVEKFLSQIVLDCQDVLNQHKAIPAQQYAQSRIFRRLVLEMMNTHSFAVSKLQEWLDNKVNSFIRFRFSCPLRTAHRRRINFMRNALAKAKDNKLDLAIDLCRAMGLIQDSINEVNELKETRLMSAAADGCSGWIISLLVDAGADVHVCRPDGVTAIWLAAQFGNSDAIEALVKHKALVDSPANDGATTVYIAAQNGHHHCIKVLCDLKADPNLADKNGISPIDQATMNIHEDCRKSLLDKGAIQGHIDQDRLLNLQAGAGPRLGLSRQQGGTKILIVSSGDISDSDGMLALAEYGKTGADMLFIMNYPAHVGISKEQYDENFEKLNPGLGYKYGSEKIIERDDKFKTPKYERLMARYASSSECGARDVNLMMKSALTDIAFALITRVWGEVQLNAGQSRGKLLFGIGGVNSINPFSEKIIKNEVLLYSELLEDPDVLASIKPVLGKVYGEDGSLVSNFSLNEYASVYMDFCGSFAFWGESVWENCFREGLLPVEGGDSKLKAAFIMGGVLTNKPPVTLPSIRGVLNRFSSATMNQLYHPEGTGGFFSFLNEYSVPTFVVTNNVVGDVTTFSDATKKSKTDEGINRFMEANELNGAFLKALARSYYNSKYNPPRKPFDVYCARALTAFMGEAGKSMQENLQRQTLFFGPVYASTLVSEHESWDVAKAEYVDIVSQLTEEGEIAEARKQETAVIKSMERKVAVTVFTVGFQLDPQSKRLELSLK